MRLECGRCMKERDAGIKLKPDVYYVILIEVFPQVLEKLLQLGIG